VRVAFIAAESEPWAKTGGLGDVVDALARALGPLGVEGSGRSSGVALRPAASATLEPDVYLPLYRGVPVRESSVLARSTIRVPDPSAPDGLRDVGLVDVAGDGYRLRLIDHPPAFDREGYYGDAAGDYPDNAWRFGLFCRAALEGIRADGGIDVLHLHDWHAAPALLLRDGPYDADPVVARAATLLTIHNLAYHGWTPPDNVWMLGLDHFVSPSAGPGVAAIGGHWPTGLAADRGVDLLRAGIERADLVNTVSPTFAAESLRFETGMGLDALLRDRGDRYFGILNGIDPGVWDPSTDPHLTARYGPSDMTGKVACRRDLLDRVGFDAADEGAVFGAIGRLDPQKGFDLLASAAPSLVAEGARFVIQASGDPSIARPLRELAAAEPRRVAFVERFDRTMARRIYAGADLFVMPSRFEPSGQGQMIALRYGTPPVVRATGGLADSVVDVEAASGSGTGFTFGPPTREALVEAGRRAMAFRADGRATGWQKLIARGMACDFAWESGPAPMYLDAYRRAVALRQEARSAG
jgi:starch synthase